MTNAYYLDHLVAMFYLRQGEPIMVELTGLGTLLGFPEFLRQPEALAGFSSPIVVMMIRTLRGGWSHHADGL